jgi:hypothetical protein
MKKLAVYGGGCVLAAIGALGLGGAAAGASTVAVPVPGVGEVGLIADNAQGGTEDCVAAQLDSEPGQPLGACVIDATTPVGSNVTAIAVMEGGTTTYVSLNPFGISSS